MGIFRPATPGFLITLAATIILAVVVFSVPYFKSIYFLKASLSNSGIDGSITFGVLGYCTDIAGNSTCTKPSVGYEFDINKLVGTDLPFDIEIPNVVVKWVTYALVLHIVALCFAAISAAFGLLAHVREMSMSCLSTCISGFGATVALLAFIFDLVLFFVAKARINKVQGGSATVGTGIWLTLAAWILLFFSGCFYGLGRCCVRRRPKKSKDWESGDKQWSPLKEQPNAQEEQSRLAAVKAEADRKTRQNRPEGGLPAFHEYTPEEQHETIPLTGRVEGDNVYVDDDHANQPYRDAIPPAQPASNQQFSGGYVPAPVGGRTVDDYNNQPRRQQSTGTTYPPQPLRQGSSHTQGPSGYSQVDYAAAAAVAVPVAAVAAKGAASNQYLTAPAHQQQHTGAIYGHGQDPTSFHTAAGHHQEPSAQAYDPYAQSHQQQHYAQPQLNPDTYNNTAYMGSPTPTYTPYAPQQPMQSPPEPPSAYYTPASEPQSYYGAAPQMPNPGAPQRSYTLGGNGYGDNVVPPLSTSPPAELQYSGYAGYVAQPVAESSRPIAGPRQRTRGSSVNERPPDYEGPLGAGGSAGWVNNEKRG